MVQKETPVRRDHRVYKARLVSQVLLVKEVHRDRKAKLANKALKVILELLVQEVKKAIKEIEDHKDYRVQ